MQTFFWIIRKMSFYGTPLKHGRGVNKPFRSPLIKTDINQDRGDGTSNSRRLNTSSKLNQNSRMKSLGLKSPMRAQGFISPLKPLEINSPSKELENKAVTKSLGFASPLKRLNYKSPSKSSETKISLRPIDNTLLKPSEKNLSSKLSENNALNSLKNKSDSKVKETDSLPKVDLSSAISSSRENCLKSKLKSPPNDLNSKSKEAKSPLKNVSLNSPPPSPMIQRIIPSLEYQPVVKLQRLSSDFQNLSKQDMAILVKRINDKQRQMVELRVKIPVHRKHNLEEIMASIMKWREAFKEALETLRESLAEKNGQYFSTSDVLKLLSIPNSIVHFSEEENDFIFPKL